MSKTASTPNNQVWFKGNKAGEKWPAEKIVSIFEETYNWLIENEKVLLKTEVSLYMLTNYGVSQQIRSKWTNDIHYDNKSICNLHNAIELTLENRVVYDQSQMRPSVQGMVLQNKHNYREKKDINETRTVTNMGRIEKDGKLHEVAIG